jgi:acyl-CoA synthetase (AMP-forming)/AMP-acid ligase II
VKCVILGCLAGADKISSNSELSIWQQSNTTRTTIIFTTDPHLAKDYASRNRKTRLMNLIDHLDKYFAECPNQVAIISINKHWTWQELEALMWSTVLSLHESSLRAGERVAISMSHPVLHFITSLALARMGVGHIAISLSESDLVRAQIIKELGVQRVITDSPELAARTPLALLLQRVELRKVSSMQRSELRAQDESLEWLILQSSGTTGAPKFASLTHRAAIDRFERFLPLFNCGHEDIFWAASRPDFVVAKQRLTFSLLSGARVCLPLVNTLNAELVTWLRELGITLACGTPSHLHQLIAHGLTLPSLRVFEARSAFIDEKLRHTFKSRVSEQLFIVYGTNEGEALALADPNLQAHIPNTVGTATSDIDLEIVDAQLQALPPMVTGEVRVKGRGVVTAYLNNPQASAKSFQGGWFYPGDLGYLTREGALVLQGRKDDMMIFDGMNIYPAEIENALSSHPAVKEVAAFAMRHERLQDVPVAAVTLSDEVSEQELMAHAKQCVGIKYPRHILILKEFPRNAMGKILKRELSAAVARLVNPSKSS